MAQVQAQSVTDTARHVLPTVQVQAARPAKYAAGSRFTSLDSTALAAYQGGTVADVLSARTPLHLKTYGPGQLASISIRGTSARHTAVLWHGFALNFPTLGEADMALLPVAGVSRIDVQHGPAASLYGSGAVGGAVVLGEQTAPAGTRLGGMAEVGSFGTRTLSVSGSQRDGRVSIRTGFMVRDARNDFTYTSREFAGVLRRRQQNAALQQSSFQQDLTVQVGRRGELSAAAWLTDANRQIQPSMGAANNHARERDQSARVVLGYRQRGLRSETVVRVAWFGDLLDYQNDDLATSHSRSAVRQAHLEHTLRWRSNVSLRLGAEAQDFVARVDGYRRSVQEQRYAGFALLRYDPTPRLRLTLNARQAALPGRQPPLTPTLGAEWEVWRTNQQQLWLKASTARSYRAPTLNERYWRPGGNPNLIPETSVGGESGLHYEATTSSQLRLQADLTAYGLVVDDWVQWIPDANGVYSPRNLRQVRTQGLEASSQLQWQLGGYALRAGAGYAFTQARKISGYPTDADPIGVQLPYVPLHAATLHTDHEWRGWLLTASGTFTGFRYTSASATEYLPSYRLLNGSVGRRFAVGRWQLTALLQGYNLGNADYQNYDARAMPGRSGTLSLRANWH
ncbi:TonB-dependent receptor [Hymenobacter busanensis]|uniref:TonB-dependent receptor n=1 Tax=Hymenobacter busanensis TaxID=2607656 RepID=UPI001366DFEF|nr:TonB-dependent receptor [Hymenobacter busanensis]QHJ08866.1 TonB-dependent receptor [Hymenobacter busanensis]